MTILKLNFRCARLMLFAAFVSVLMNHASVADWGVELPVGHPRFCEYQEIRVSRIAEYLLKQIYERSMDMSTSGYILSRDTYIWVSEVRTKTGNVMDNMRFKRGIQCAKFAQITINYFEKTWQEVLAYRPDDISTFPSDHRRLHR